MEKSGYVVSSEQENGAVINHLANVLAQVLARKVNDFIDEVLNVQKVLPPEHFASVITTAISDTKLNLILSYGGQEIIDGSVRKASTDLFDSLTEYERLQLESAIIHVDLMGKATHQTETSQSQ